jgi:hypothetical protein
MMSTGPCSSWRYVFCLGVGASRKTLAILLKIYHTLYICIIVP